MTLRFKCYRVWFTRAKRSRFMTARQLRFFLGIPTDEPLTDWSVEIDEMAINWERVPGGATEGDLVLWNLKGEI